jgi:hypothetical protein
MELIEDVDVGHPARGWHLEADEVGRCLRAGLLESPTMPVDESISVMETLDEIRRQIGLIYPFESRVPTLGTPEASRSDP